MRFYDWTDISAVGDDYSALTVTLSGLTRSLLIAMLRSAAWRYLWTETDTDISDTEWDNAEIALAAALQEINTGITLPMLPIGMIIITPIYFVPDGYLICNGQQYLRADYPILAETLGEDYRIGDDYFVVPQFDNLFPVGAGDDYTLGDTDGESEHTLTESEIPSHRHGVTFNGRTGVSGAPDTTRFSSTTSQGSNFTLSANSAYTGGGAAHNNIPPCLGVLFLIKCDE